MIGRCSNMAANACVALLAAVALSPARADIVSWVGSGNWSVAANWSGGSAPGAADDVIFDGASSTNNAAIDAAFGGEVASITISNNYTGAITQWRDLHVAGNFDMFGATWCYTNATPAGLVIDGDMYLDSLVQCQYASLAGSGAGRTFTVGGNLTVDSNGVFNADGIGFPAQRGPAPGLSTPMSAWASGSHGGCGDNNAFNTYGSIHAPDSLGSGGRDAPGGGAIGLLVTGDALIDGVVSAKGASYGAYWGGAGGSVYIAASTLAGTGVVSVIGGVNSTYQYGAGGGGRIAVALASGNDFGSVNYQAWGGVCYYFSAASGRNAGAGTLYLQTALQGPSNGVLIVDNNSSNSVPWLFARGARLRAP